MFLHLYMYLFMVYIYLYVHLTLYFSNYICLHLFISPHTPHQLATAAAQWHHRTAFYSFLCLIRVKFQPKVAAQLSLNLAPLVGQKQWAHLAWSRETFTFPLVSLWILFSDTPHARWQPRNLAFSVYCCCFYCLPLRPSVCLSVCLTVSPGRALELLLETVAQF